MRSSLSVCPSPPTITLPDASVIPDQRYKVVPMPDGTLVLPAATPGGYNGQYLIHGQPTVAAPANASLVIRDGLTNWTWADVIAQFPAVQKYLMRCAWREATGYKRGHRATYDAQVLAAAVLQTYDLDTPPHMWAGDV